MQSAPIRLAVLGFGFVIGAIPLQGQSSPPVTRVVYDMKKVVERSALPESEVQGRKLFVQRCALCHNPLGQPSGVTSGPWLDQTTVTKRGEDRVRETITVGIRKMPGWQYTLQPAQVDQVISYLKTVTPDQRPQTATGARGAGVDDDLLR